VNVSPARPSAIRISSSFFESFFREIHSSFIIFLKELCNLATAFSAATTTSLPRSDNSCDTMKNVHSMSWNEMAAELSSAGVMVGKHIRLVSDLQSLLTKHRSGLASSPEVGTGRPSLTVEQPVVAPAPMILQVDLMCFNGNASALSRKEMRSYLKRNKQQPKQNMARPEAEALVQQHAKFVRMAKMAENGSSARAKMDKRRRSDRGSGNPAHLKEPKKKETQEWGNGACHHTGVEARGSQ